jgi:hypothetical protein
MLLNERCVIAILIPCCRASHRGADARAQYFEPRSESVDCARAYPTEGQSIATTTDRAKMKKIWKKSYLLKLLDGTLVNTSALVDQVTCDIYEYVKKR